ncbi:hypothetical protein N7U66_15250 [Lacinutrix neustonica]|uniref:Uncharacterized protein n=1 Tax=Lacinutrix neustonica TaxID=2980107 RepID=A0A9E8SCK1_9FLAO|nr:hypothetical protein [Lacinutrix neustonica]WAC01398.1 hypothetical protein N7U66_15250 [Lacinutrix neustonica]
MILAKIIGPEFNGDKNLMIHLYDKNTKKIKADLENERYWDWNKNNSHKYQSFLIGSKNSNVMEDAKNHLYLDQYDF